MTLEAIRFLNFLDRFRGIDWLQLCEAGANRLQRRCELQVGWKYKFEKLV
jgi:hypothetical protein